MLATDREVADHRAEDRIDRLQRLQHRARQSPRQHENRDIVGLHHLAQHENVELREDPREHVGQHHRKRERSQGPPRARARDATQRRAQIEELAAVDGRQQARADGHGELSVHDAFQPGPREPGDQTACQQDERSGDRRDVDVVAHDAQGAGGGDENPRQRRERRREGDDQDRGADGALVERLDVVGGEEQCQRDDDTRHQPEAQRRADDDVLLAVVVATPCGHQEANDTALQAEVGDAVHRVNETPGDRIQPLHLGPAQQRHDPQERPPRQSSQLADESDQ